MIDLLSITNGSITRVSPRTDVVYNVMNDWFLGDYSNILLSFLLVPIKGIKQSFNLLIFLLHTQSLQRLQNELKLYCFLKSSSKFVNLPEKKKHATRADVFLSLPK